MPPPLPPATRGPHQALGIQRLEVAKAPASEADKRLHPLAEGTPPLDLPRLIAVRRLPVGVWIYLRVPSCEDAGELW
jgi:hypothetical protein